jgi:hypothetical protein
MAHLELARRDRGVDRVEIGLREGHRQSTQSSDPNPLLVRRFETGSGPEPAPFSARQ